MLCREKKIRRAKRGVRSELSVSKGDWRKHNYAETGVLRQASYCCGPRLGLCSQSLLCAALLSNETLRSLAYRQLSHQIG